MNLFDFLEPSPVSIPNAVPDDPRLANLFGCDPNAAKICLIGFPVDEGVRRNGGRFGAALAPDLIRTQLFKLTPDARFPEMKKILAGTVDWGNLRVSGDMEADQEALGRLVAHAFDIGALPVILGGGHETAFGHFLGYAKSGKPVSIVNLDAHADVRELKEGCGHSGSPFRQALQHPAGTCRNYSVAGLLPWSVSAAHVEFIRAHGGRAVFHDEIDEMLFRTLYFNQENPVMATFDIDAVEQSAAPGVSAPGPGGMAVGKWLEGAFEAGRSPSVTSFDIVEMNPNFDPDNRTARLAALTVWHFLRGLTERSHSPAR